MREIKFRVKSRWNNTWHYTHSADPEAMALKWNPETIGQYTGLKDRHGKEIYEGDILTSGTDEPRICEVVYRDDKAGFYVEYEPHEFSEPMWIFGRINDDRREIVGNVWEHPDLLPDAHKRGE